MTESRQHGSQGWLWAPVGLSALGVLVSTYLSVKRFTGGSLVCTRWAQCDTVNNSVYAKFYGVPVAFIGLAGYLAILGLTLAAQQASGLIQRRLLALTFGLALAGFAFSVYLTYIELFVLQAVCIWCVASAILITLLAIVGGVNLWRSSPEPAETSPVLSSPRR